MAFCNNQNLTHDLLDDFFKFSTFKKKKEESCQGCHEFWIFLKSRLLQKAIEQSFDDGNNAFSCMPLKVQKT